MEGLASVPVYEIGFHADTVEGFTNDWDDIGRMQLFAGSVKESGDNVDQSSAPCGT